MPSLTKGVRLGAPKSRTLFVSFSVNSVAAGLSQARKRSPSSGCEAVITAVAPVAVCRSAGRGASPPHDHVLRNQRVGRTCSVAASGPRFVTVIWISRSSGAPLAYSTSTSKYRSWSNTPVSRSSYSKSCFPRRRFVSTRSPYGNSAGYCRGTSCRSGSVSSRGRRDPLDVLAVVPLAVRQTEQPLLEDGIPAVPQGEREAQKLAVIGDPRQPVLAPAIGARPRLVVTEVVPGVARLAVVLADGRPTGAPRGRDPTSARALPPPAPPSAVPAPMSWIQNRHWSSLCSPPTG